MLVSHTFLFLVTLRVLKNARRVYCRMPLHWGLSDVFLIKTRVIYGFGRGTHTGEVPFSSHIKGTCYKREVVFVRLLPLPLSILSSLEGSHYVQTTLEKWGALLPLPIFKLGFLSFHCLVVRLLYIY